MRMGCVWDVRFEGSGVRGRGFQVGVEEGRGVEEEMRREEGRYGRRRGGEYIEGLEKWFCEIATVSFNWCTIG